MTYVVGLIQVLDDLYEVPSTLSLFYREEVEYPELFLKSVPSAMLSFSFHATEISPVIG